MLLFTRIEQLAHFRSGGTKTPIAAIAANKSVAGSGTVENADEPLPPHSSISSVTLVRLDC